MQTLIKNILCGVCRFKTSSIIYRNNGSEMLTFIKSVDYIKEPSLKEIPLRQFIEQINEVFTIASRK